MSSFFTRLAGKSDNHSEEGSTVEPLRFSQGYDNKDFDDPRLKNIPIHEQHLLEMERKRKQLLDMDQQLVNEINEAHKSLASVRMAVRGVEDMMASIRANPLVPPVIKSINEFRAKPTPSEVRKEIKNKEDAAFESLAEELKEEISKEIDNSENY